MCELELFSPAGNLHQSQYCDRIKVLVEFLGTKLSLDELTTIWKMQVRVFQFVLMQFNTSLWRCTGKVVKACWISSRHSVGASVLKFVALLNPFYVFLYLINSVSTVPIVVVVLMVLVVAGFDKSVVQDY